jgi:glycosyltransferase involved in cell wall biosynthesis
LSNLLLLCEYATLNGGERSMLATLDAVKAAGFSIAAIAPPDGPLADALQSQDVEVVPFNTLDAAGIHRQQSQLREELAQLLQSRRPDLLHANSLSMGRLAAPVAAELNVPCISHLRDIVRLSRQAAADLNRNRLSLAVSRAVKDFHVQNGIDGRKIQVVHNGVDLDEFQPRAATGYLHRELGLDASDMLIGTIGQIGPRKGQDILVRAAIGLVDLLPRAHFMIVGERFSDKDESRRFECDLREHIDGPLKGRAHMLGYRNDANRLLNELTMLVHPARQEPLGRVLLEAAASGVPVVATDVGGTREIFPSDLQCARLVPSGDSDSLADAILQLAGDAQTRRNMAEAARRRAQEAFDIRRTAAALVNCYRDLI